MVMDRSRVALTRPVHPGTAAGGRRRGGTAPPGSRRARWRSGSWTGCGSRRCSPAWTSRSSAPSPCTSSSSPAGRRRSPHGKTPPQDQADLIGQEKKGRIVDDETELALSAANRRANDLRDGSGHHGANWVAYLQVSTPDEDALAHVSGVIEEAADQAGITRLDWLDTVQSAAHATTWPLGRGITPPTRSRTMKTLHAVPRAPRKRHCDNNQSGGGAGERRDRAAADAGPADPLHVPVASRHVEGHLTGGADHHPAGGGPEHRAHRVTHR